MFSFKQGFKRARKKTGLSQEGFACKYHFSLPTVKKWEQGKAVPDFGTLCDLCGIFQCSMDYLVAEDELPSHDLQFIHDEIGLTLESIEKLQRIRTERKEYSDALSALIMGGNFEYLLYLLDKRFAYSAPEMNVKPIIKNIDGEVHCTNAKEYHNSLQKREVNISLDGSQIVAQKKNLIDTLICSALTDNMQNMANEYVKIKENVDNHVDCLILY